MHVSGFETAPVPDQTTNRHPHSVYLLDVIQDNSTKAIPVPVWRLVLN